LDGGHPDAGDREERDVKYMLLIYDNADTREAFFGPDAGPLMTEIDAIMQELTDSGELIGTQALADPSNTRTIRPVDGVPAVTDGPFAESKEHMGGYLLLDCESIERATEIALRWPNSRFGAMEVRPVMDGSGAEM
jgi:hypothetical protein